MLTEIQHKEFAEIVKPVMKWLNDNCHPHVEITIEPGRAEFKEGVATTVAEEFIKD